MGSVYQFNITIEDPRQEPTPSRHVDFGLICG
jgi:hypothetical protein